MPRSQPAISGDLGISGRVAERAVEDDLGGRGHEQQREQRRQRRRPLRGAGAGETELAPSTATLTTPLASDAALTTPRPHNAVQTVLVSRYASRPVAAVLAADARRP